MLNPIGKRGGLVQWVKSVIPIHRLPSATECPTCAVRTAACSKGTAVALVPVLAIVAVAINAQPIASPKCAMRLSVEVTPDVPNPANGGFISSLLGNHTEYQLFLLRLVDDTHVDLQLQGPGPDDRCQAVVDDMRNDGRILSMETT
jgi:hypothetical protein